MVGLKSGVAGAAIATVLSEALAAIACILYAFAKVPQFRQAFQHRAINKNLIWKTIQVGVPIGLQYALIYVSSIILQRIVNGFGESVIVLLPRPPKSSCWYGRFLLRWVQPS